MALTVKVEDYSGEVLEELDNKVSVALEACGLAAERFAKDICPWVTGRLRGSITYATQKKHGSGQEPAEPQDYEPQGTPEKGSVYIGTNVEYAPFVELGSSRRKDPKPFLKPAIANNTDKYKQIFEQYLKGNS